MKINRENPHSQDEIACIVCQCTESAPCLGGCAWAAVDPEAGVGLCTRCAAKPLERLILEQKILM